MLVCLADVARALRKSFSFLVPAFGTPQRNYFMHLCTSKALNEGFSLEDPFHKIKLSIPIVFTLINQSLRFGAFPQRQLSQSVGESNVFRSEPPYQSEDEARPLSPPPPGIWWRIPRVRTLLSPTGWLWQKCCKNGFLHFTHRCFRNAIFLIWFWTIHEPFFGTSDNSGPSGLGMGIYVLGLALLACVRCLRACWVGQCREVHIVSLQTVPGPVLSARSQARPL